MWKKTYTQTFKDLNRETIWRIWTDINNWTTWHDDLDYCKIEGDFAVGNHFMLKPEGAPAVKIMLTQINKGYSFTDCTTFFGAKMYDTHSMMETENGLELTNTLIVKGPLKWLWIKLVAKNVADSIPHETENLAKLARGGK
jgi:hypothetical protein